MKKYTLNIIKTDKTFRLKTNKDIKLLHKLLKWVWGKKNYKKMEEFYDFINQKNSDLDEALEKAFPNK